MAEPKIKSKQGHKPIYVLAGKNDTLVNARCRELLDELIEPSQRAMGLFDADPARISAADVMDELRTLPFLADRRVVLIRDADNFVSDNRELLEKYFDAPCPTGTLVLKVSTWNANTKLAKKLPGVGELINVTQPKPWQLPTRLMQYAREAYDKKIGKDAAELLVELVGDELPRLYNEVDKLALFAEGEKAITPGHIELLIGHNRLYNAFAVIDAIAAGNVGQAVERLRRMFAEDRTTEYTVVGAFAFHLRRMFGAKALLEKGSRPADIAKRLRIWSNKDKFFAQLQQMSLKQIGQYLQKLGETDHAIKTGRAKPQVAMEQLVLSLAGDATSVRGS